jgi:hypothetical protein
MLSYSNYDWIYLKASFPTQQAKFERTSLFQASNNNDPQKFLYLAPMFRSIAHSGKRPKTLESILK